MVLWLTLVLKVALVGSLTSASVGGRPGRPKCLQRRLQEDLMLGGGGAVVLTSPNYPAAYDYHTTCGWRIRPTDRTIVVTMTCASFHLQSVNAAGECLDYLKVKGTRYCGRKFPLSVSFSSTLLKVVFKTNGRRNYPGFNCTVRASNPGTSRCWCRGRVRSSLTEERVEKIEFPWMAALVRANTSTPFCSASVVCQSWVLTSAACAQRMKHNKYNYKVIVGSHNLTKLSPEQQVRIPVRKVVIHPRYLPGVVPAEHNIALVHLKEALTFSRAVWPVCLPDPHTDYTHRRGVLAHWDTASGGRGVPWKTLVRLFPQTRCGNHNDNKTTPVSPAWLCAAPVNTTSIITTTILSQVDQGGSLVTKTNDLEEEEGVPGHYVQVGVTASRRISSKEAEGPSRQLWGIYTNVSNYLGWITKTIGPDSTCH